MKERNGWVSNSSTSSFCIFGVCCDDIDRGAEKDEGDDCYLSWDEIHEKLRELDARFELEDIDGTKFVGIPFTTIKDDETGSQFKKNVAVAISKVLGRDIKCDTYMEAWRDG